MRILAISTALLLGSTALASSELQVKSSMPVILVLDNETLGTIQPLEPLLVDIDSGVHNLRLRGMLGKDLYDRDLIFDDDTRTELVWQRKELRLGAVVKLDPNRVPDSDGSLEQDLEYASAEQPAPNPEPPPVDVEHDHGEKAVAATPAPRDGGRPVLARPSSPVLNPFDSNPTSQAPPIQAPPMVRDVPVPATPRGTGGSVVIEATPGMDLSVTHGTQRLRITVENGELVVEDARGTEIHFPSDGAAF